MNDPTTTTGRASAWQQVTYLGEPVDAFAAELPAGLGMVAKRYDGRWLPIAAPADQAPLHIGKPVTSRHNAQRHAERELATV